MDITRTTDVRIAKDDTVTVTKMGHLVEVQHMEKRNAKSHVRKLDSNRYVVNATGEIKQFEKSANRGNSYNSLRKTFKKLRYLINNNFNGLANELHITLTYAENMTDTKRLYSDFKNFMDRLKYHYGKDTKLEYINVVEPQERGAWHCHLLLKLANKDKAYIDPNKLAELWGHGFVKIKSLKDVDNIGAYLSAYLADVELTDTIKNDEGCEIVTKEVDGVEKRFIKGGRLHMYPSGMNLYRKSKGIIPPEREHMEYQDIKKIVGSAEPHYQSKIEIVDEDFNNTISFQEYNLKRKP